MQRDWDTLRWLLSIAESCDGGCPLVLTNGAIYGGKHYAINHRDREEDFGKIYEHILLLGDSGLAEIRELGHNFEGPSGAVIDRLTMKGHDFIEAARNDNAWEKTKSTVQQFGGATVDIFKEILISYIKVEINKHTGLNLQ